MPKTKISEFSATPANNTDIDSINISEGCAPSGINDAIRELMAQLKDFQTGAVGDSFNGPVGTTTAAAGAFTTLSASGAVTLSGGTANGVAYLNGSKVVTSGSALTFDGTTLNNSGAFGTSTAALTLKNSSAANSSNIVEQQFFASNSFSGLDTIAKFGALNPSAGGNNYGTFYWSLANAGSPSEQMRLTSTGLGIGTSSPTSGISSTQTVLEIANGNVAALSLNNTAAKKFTIYSSVSSSLVFYDVTAGANRITLDSSGNLGLGVTPSAWNSASKAMQISTTATFWGLNNNQAYVGSNSFYDQAGNFKYIVTDSATQYRQWQGAHTWHTAPSGTAGNAITFTQAMTLDASGNLLVGRSSGTGARIDVYNSGSGDATIRVGNAQNGFTNSFGKQGGTAYGANAIGDGFVYSDSSLSIMADNGTGVIKFSAGGNTERARIDSGGNLLVGTTSAGGNGFTLYPTGSGGGVYTVYNRPATSNTTTALDFKDGGTTVGSISYTNTVTSFNITSDQRLKENIQDSDSASSLIDSLQVRQYDWKANGAHQRYGFVAQELVTVAPEAVYQPEDTEQMMAVDYSKLVPMLVKEIQSLRKRLADAGIA